jgi:hypothetical protein
MDIQLLQKDNFQYVVIDDFYTPDELKLIKSIYIEPKLANECDAVWNAYSNKALSDKGAALFCVMVSSSSSLSSLLPSSSSSSSSGW